MAKSRIPVRTPGMPCILNRILDWNKSVLVFLLYYTTTIYTILL